jgi:hypothetical protein
MYLLPCAMPAIPAIANITGRNLIKVLQFQEKRPDTNCSRYQPPTSIFQERFPPVPTARFIVSHPLPCPTRRENRVLLYIYIYEN